MTEHQASIFAQQEKFNKEKEALQLLCDAKDKDLENLRVALQTEITAHQASIFAQQEKFNKENEALQLLCDAKDKDLANLRVALQTEITEPRVQEIERFRNEREAEESVRKSEQNVVQFLFHNQKQAEIILETCKNERVFRQLFLGLKT